MTEPAVPALDEPPGVAGKAPKLKAVRLLAFIVVPGLFMAFLTFGLLRTTEKKFVGKPAPEFEMPLLGGGSLSSAQLKGKPVVFNFWASWCIPCRQEAATLEAAWRKYKDQGVMFVGVNINDSIQDAQGFVDEFKITYPSIRDTDLKLQSQMSVRGLPETFFVDRSYRFVATGGTAQVGSQGGTKILGAISPAVLDSEIRSLLASGAGGTG